MSRNTVEQLIKHYPETRYCRIDAAREGLQSDLSDAYALFECLIDPITKTYLSEDFAFCQRWKAIGGGIALHRGICLSHTGNSTFQGDLMQRRTTISKINQPPLFRHNKEA